MRRFSTIVLVAAAAITVTATTAGSAYAGESTTRLDSPALLVTSTSTDYHDDLIGGCRSKREGLESPAAVERIG